MMNRRKLLVAATLAMIVSVAGWNTVRGVGDEAGGEEAAVRRCVDTYYRGVIGGDEDLIFEAWDVDNGHMKFVNKRGGSERVGVVEISTAVQWWTRVTANTSSSRVLDIDIVDDEMAMVKYEFIYNRLHYTEYLTLLKASGTWKIVSKVYVQKKLEG